MASIQCAVQSNLHHSTARLQTTVLRDSMAADGDGKFIVEFENGTFAKFDTDIFQGSAGNGALVMFRMLMSAILTLVAAGDGDGSAAHDRANSLAGKCVRGKMKGGGRGGRK